jgi:hypothetical protein
MENHMKTQNFATTRSTNPTVRVSGKTLVYRKKISDEWTNVPIEKPFAFDLPSLQHGWVRFEKGKRAEFELQPASTPWTDDEANAMIADGFVFAVTAKMSSAEIGGLHELQVTDGSIINAINELVENYVCHPSAALGEIPVVSHQIDEMGNHSFVTGGFTKRHPDFGTALNPIPRLPTEPEPLPGPETHDAATDRSGILARLELRKAQAQKQLA